MSGVAHVLRPHAHADQAGRDAAQRREARQQPQRQRRLQLLAGAQQAVDDIVLQEDLHALGDAGRKLAPLLHARGDRARSGSPGPSGFHRTFAAATASCTARLMPTPPIGDIACAASPMQSSPGRCQRSSRSTTTVSSLMSSQSSSYSTRSAKAGTSAAMLCRNAGRPARFVSSIVPFGIRKAHCQ